MVGKTRKFYRLVNVLLSEGFVLYVQTAEVVDVLADVQLVEYGNVLHDNAYLRLCVVALGGHFLSEYLDIAVLIRQERQKAVYGGTLSRTVRSKKSQHLAFLYLQAQVVNGGQLLILFNKVFDLYNSVFHVYLLSILSLLMSQLNLEDLCEE